MKNEPMKTYENGQKLLVNSGKVGVLLVNLGTPEATDYWSMRRYLHEFLSDRRVIETPRWLWWPLLNLIILTTRPGRKGKDYDTVWNKERNEGPLKTITRSQAEKLAAMLQAEMGAKASDIVVDWAMRYGKPPIDERIEFLLGQGCDRILVVPLYPQYSAATSATVCDHMFRALMKMRWQPTVRIAHPYYNDPVYIDALVASMERDLAKLPFKPEKILVSFHGVPESYIEKGDPYYEQCAETYRMMREKIGWSADDFLMGFQSRFGTEEWIKPYTDATVKSLAASGVKKMAIVAPGFSADCLETLEELDGENRYYFEDGGGEQYAFLPCLNDTEDGMRVIDTVVKRELEGWI
jgi:ferrochelatase